MGVSKGYTPEEDDSGCRGATEETVETSGQEKVMVGLWVTSVWSGGHAPSLCPLSDLGRVPWDAVRFVQWSLTQRWQLVDGPP